MPLGGPPVSVPDKEHEYIWFVLIRNMNIYGLVVWI